MEETRKPVIQVKDLYKVYRVGDTKVRALNGVDFTIYKGEFCSIVGTSGSGKSTLLNMLAGLEKPTKGEIIIAGEHMENKSENQLVKFRREHIGFIFQSFNLMPTMTAVENVALPLTFQGMSKNLRMKKASALLDLVGLKKYKKHKPTQMSGGQQQRVGVARALVVNPEIIFADEPTGNLDSNTSQEVMELMQKVVREKQQTLVMVTHDNHLASFADRIFHIIDGKIVQIEDNRAKRSGLKADVEEVQEAGAESAEAGTGEGIKGAVAGGAEGKAAGRTEGASARGAEGKAAESVKGAVAAGAEGKTAGSAGETTAGGIEGKTAEDGAADNTVKNTENDEVGKHEQDE